MATDRVEKIILVTINDKRVTKGWSNGAPGRNQTQDDR
jgi:peroxiredoxin